MRTAATCATVLLVSLCSFVPARAQETDGSSGCRSRSYEANTDRPTYTNSTATTPCGVIEITGGLERQWTGHGLHQDDYAQGLQFGLTPKIDIHYSANLYFEDGGSYGPLSGTGDKFIGVRYRFSLEKPVLPSFGVFYTVKVPSARPSAGLSSGRFDHTVSLLASKDISKRLHLDFNLTPQWIGNAETHGWDRNLASVLFASVPLTARLAFVAGSYGFTRLNDTAPAYAVSSAGFDWQVSHRLILDAAFDEGLNSAAPRKRIGFGFTYAPANFYAISAAHREPRADTQSGAR